MSQAIDRQAENESRAVRNSVFGMTLRSAIDIAASPAEVWRVLTDFDGYRHWNPAIPSAKGEATPGTVLHVVIHWPGLRASKYELEVLGSTVNRELRWLGHFMGRGLLDGDHSFLLEPRGETESNVTQIEKFSGILVPFFAPWLRKNVLEGFGMMNAALKERVEQLADTRIQRE